MKQRENTQVIVRNYYHNGGSFDFTLWLHQIQESIERHRERIELADTHNLEAESPDALPELIFTLRRVKDILNGRFDILIINDSEHDRE